LARPDVYEFVDHHITLVTPNRASYSYVLHLHTRSHVWTAVSRKPKSFPAIEHGFILITDVISSAAHHRIVIAIGYISVLTLDAQDTDRALFWFLCGLRDLMPSTVPMQIRQLFAELINSGFTFFFFLGREMGQDAPEEHFVYCRQKWIIQLWLTDKGWLEALTLGHRLSAQSFLGLAICFSFWSVPSVV